MKNVKDKIVQEYMKYKVILKTDTYITILKEKSTMCPVYMNVLERNLKKLDFKNIEVGEILLLPFFNKEGSFELFGDTDNLIKDF